MKKTLILAFALLASLCACTKQIEIQEDSQKQTIIAHVNIATKVAYSENTAGGGSGLSSVWEEGDKFLAIQDGTTVIEFTLIDGAGSNQATFQAEAEGVTSETRWTAVLGSSASPHTSEIHCGYLGQSGKLSGIGAYNYVKALGEGLEPTFDFDGGEKLSYILRVKLPAGVKCIEYTPCGWYKVEAESTSTQYLNTSEENNYGSSRTTIITLASLSSAGDIIYISLPCLDFSRTFQTYNSNKQNGNLRSGVIITLLNNESDYATASNGTVIEDNLSNKGGRIGTFDMSSIELIKRPALAETINYSTENEQSINWCTGVKQSASAVNTYWAPFNIGATSATEVGTYFSFGELDSSKSVFSWVSFHNRHKTDGSTFRNDVTSNQRKPASNTSFYSIAGSRYDVARVKWGVDWRMPHCIEIYTLWNGGSTERVSGGVKHTCTATGTSIVIPDSGLKAHNDNGEVRDMSAKDQLTKDTTSYEPTGNNMPRFWTADKNQRSHDNAGWNEAVTYGPASDYSNGDYWRRFELCGVPVRAVHASSTIAWR